MTAGPDSPQRRDAVRVECVVAVHVGRPGEPMAPCSGVDLSGSGLSAQVEGLELTVGETVDVYLRMDNGVEIEAGATVVRAIAPGAYGFRFDELTPYLREILIKHVFARQRRILAERSGRA